VRATARTPVSGKSAPRQLQEAVESCVTSVIQSIHFLNDQNETIPLGLIPLGNGDDFAKVIPPEASIGGKPFDWRAAVQKIAREQTQLIDAGRIVGDHLLPGYGDGAHYFINGMDVDSERWPRATLPSLLNS
jgi:diacylglycerol kinase family enzyme